MLGWGEWVIEYLFDLQGIALNKDKDQKKILQERRLGRVGYCGG
jgi:hypothetical protein